MPAGAAAAFGPIGLNQLWQNVNAGADSGWSARAMQAMYRQATGREIDGVIALDVPALAALLDASGPIDVPALGQRLDGDNLARVLLHEAYDRDGRATAARANRS